MKHGHNFFWEQANWPWRNRHMNIQGKVGSRFAVSKARTRNKTRRNARTEHTMVRGTGCSNGIDERSREYDVTLAWYRSWVYVTRVSTSRRSPSAESNEEGRDSSITQRTYTAVLFSLRFVRNTTTVTLSVPRGAEHNITAHSVVISFINTSSKYLFCSFKYI